MAEWVHIKDGVIDEYHGALPKSWKNISGLDKGDELFLLSHGWYRVEKQYQSYNEETQKVDSCVYEILSDRVIERLNIVDLTAEEISNTIEEKKRFFFNTLRSERNSRLSRSDWTQVNDLIDIKGENWVNLWKQYRQELRELPSKYENSTDYDVSHIVWPNVPGG